MREKDEQDHSIVCAGVVGTVTGGLLGTLLGFLYMVYLIRNPDRFDSKELSTYILFCVLSTPASGITGAALGGSAGVGGAFTAKIARKTFSFFQELLSKQDSLDDRCLDSNKASSATC
ncbi:hypothetical protein Lnau_1607 [Legionella nautarum]|uniref:Transmembrane protein n=1 Tax=Legionella nautarum TaxID=45070 RepID=A0A0W0WWE2_9GAMM|nr:hypothetical protein [Legionella nautarum]KTD36623.1 hypothetical protein Lnau_1607 [Legionella nautarum]